MTCLTLFWPANRMNHRLIGMKLQQKPVNRCGGNSCGRTYFEGYIEVRKTSVRACLEHRGYSKTFESYVWEEILKNNRGYKTPRIPYLLEAFLFDSKRLLRDDNYNQLEDQILFSLIEYVRNKKLIL